MSPTTGPASVPGKVLLLSEDDVRRVLTMEMALEAVELGLRKLGLSEAENVPRSRVQTDHVVLHVMSAAAKSVGYLGAKLYASSRKAPAHFHVALYDGKTGALLSLMRADWLGQVRTGAASAVATRVLARPDAAEVGLFGSGKQARTQVQAICLVRKVRRISVFSPNQENRTRFAAEMSQLCQVEVVPVDQPEQAAQNKDIVITATTAREPILKGAWLAPGTHVNAIGSNFMGKAELDLDAIQRFSTIVVDSKDQARIEAGDFQEALEKGLLNWADVRELGPLLIGRYPGRQKPEDVTLFKSLGLAIEDVVVAGGVYQQAVAAGLGSTIEW
jgi:ornithine cyclodeaminase/alanine dehydrogenase-like protein (mu-crystallin family)